VACRLLGVAVVKLSLSTSYGVFAVLLFAASSSTTASGASGDYSRRDDLTKAVISCEEAYTRLESCCPGFDPFSGDSKRSANCLDVEWQHTTGGGGCDGPATVDRGDTEPLAIAESECIRALTCEELVASGVCDRAMNDPTSAGPSGGRPARRGICP
jgi:hypothetical protein